MFHLTQLIIGLHRPAELVAAGAGGGQPLLGHLGSGLGSAGVAGGGFEGGIDLRQVDDRVQPPADFRCG
jgi:hypothetical protein